MAINLLFDIVNQLNIICEYNIDNSITKIPAAKNNKTINKKIIVKLKKKGSSNVIGDDEENSLEEEKEINIKKTKEKNRERNKIKEDSIITIIDDSDDETEDGLDIQIDTFHGSSHDAAAGIMQYQQLIDQYKRFLEAYLKEDGNAVVKGYDYSMADDKKDREFIWGQEVATYHEIKDSIRKIKMNLLLGGWHNGVSPDEKDRYKFWKYCSKFNKVMADVIETSISSGG